MHRFWDIQLHKCCVLLENQVSGPSRSLKMSPFDRAHTTSYWHSIVTMALSSVVSDIFNVKKYRDLGIMVKGQSAVSDFKWQWKADHEGPLFSQHIVHNTLIPFYQQRSNSIRYPMWGRGVVAKAHPHHVSRTGAPALPDFGCRHLSTHPLNYNSQTGVVNHTWKGVLLAH